MPHKHPLIFISAAEQSADNHGAALIRATLARCPNARFVGVAGPQMTHAGCESIYDMTAHSAMLLGSMRIAGRAAAMLRTVNHHLRTYPFDAAVLIDSPVLHLRVARRASGAGVPVLYYIAPQLWAWGAGRISKLRNWVDCLAVILPFEEEYFRSRGVTATFVGHPLAERIADCGGDEGTVDAIRARGAPVIAMLPGSRRQVVREVLPGQLRVGAAIASAYSSATFGVSVANPHVEPIIRSIVADSSLHVRLHAHDHTELIRAADLVLVASGTSTLEVGLHRRPMIVMYNASRMFYQLIGRWMIRTPYLSLPNILAGGEIVPEFMPYYRSTEPIAARAIELLESPGAREQMLQTLQAVVEPLRLHRPSERTAALLLDLVARRRAAQGVSAEPAA
ncbi:MAG: lipid-A-disaccharide synthase [Phycisphaerae bacterium]